MGVSIANMIRFANSLRNTALVCGRAEYTFTDGLHVAINCQDHHYTLVLERLDNYLDHELCDVFAAAFNVPEGSTPVRTCPREPHAVTGRKRTVYRIRYDWREIPASQCKSTYSPIGA